MKEIDNILTESKKLKEMPYSVPEGYFESLGAKVRERIGQEEKLLAGRRVSRVSPARFIPWLCAAAVAAVVVTLGLTLGFRGGRAVVPEDGLQDSDYVFYYTEIIPVTEPESIYYSYISDSEDPVYVGPDYADQIYDDTSLDGLSYEDILEYLAQNGVDINILLHN